MLKKKYQNICEKKKKIKAILSCVITLLSTRYWSQRVQVLVLYAFRKKKAVLDWHYLCLPSHLVHIMVFMASFRSSCSFVKNSFMDLESSVAAMRFLRGVGGNKTDTLKWSSDIMDLKNTTRPQKSLCSLESIKYSYCEIKPTDSIDFWFCLLAKAPQTKDSLIMLPGVKYHTQEERETGEKI